MLKNGIRLLIIISSAYLIFDSLQRYNFDFSRVMDRGLAWPIFIILVVLVEWAKECFFGKNNEFSSLLDGGFFIQFYNIMVRIKQIIGYPKIFFIETISVISSFLRTEIFD